MLRSQTRERRGKALPDGTEGLVLVMGTWPSAIIQAASYLFYPEVKGMTLEDIKEIFQHGFGIPKCCLVPPGGQRPATNVVFGGCVPLCYLIMLFIVGYDLKYNTSPLAVQI